jgi:hypothetical protein
MDQARSPNNPMLNEVHAETHSKEKIMRRETTWIQNAQRTIKGNHQFQTVANETCLRRLNS